jgi:CHAT domain-containing protein/tetratricopeptide (TPR) repeat protein
MSSRRGGELVVLCLVALAAQAAAPPAELTKGQKAKLAQRDRLVKSLPELVRKQQFHKATDAQERIAALEKEVLGETDARVIGSLQQLAGWREALGQFVKAIRVRQEVVRLLEKRLGKGHWQTTDARLALQDSRRRAAMSPEGRAALLQAQAENGRVEQLHQQGKLREAVQMAVKVTAAFRQVLGEKHPAYAVSLNDLALLYKDRGEHRKALPLYREALALLRQAPGEKHPSYATSLNNLGVLHREMGEHEKALPLLLEARQLRRQVLGEKHSASADSLNNLAALYQEMGEPGKALPLFLEARRLRHEVLGERHPHYAQSLDNLASLYLEMGEHGKALPLLLEARELRRKVLGEEHRLYTISLNNLALLYQAMGEHGKALPLFREARTLLRQALGEKHPLYATSLNNLAWLYHERGEHQKALPLYQQALRLTREAVGEKHPDYAVSLHNLAALYYDLGEHKKALPLFRQARQLHRQVWGEKHPTYASSLNNLAVLYQHMGEHQKALPLFLEARDLRREVLGGKHPHYAISLNNLALLHRAGGKLPLALASSSEALKVLEAYLDDGFDHLGEQQRTWILQAVLYNLGVLLSLQEQAGEPASRRYAAVLAWKGCVAARGRLDRLAREQPELKEPLQKLQGVRARLTRLGLQTPPPARHAAWLKQLRTLDDEKVRLEALLSGRSGPLRGGSQRRTPEQLAKELPDGIAFVDLLEYDHYTAPKGNKGEAPKERRLLAFVVRRGREPVAMPLGAMKPLADAVARWRAEVEKVPARANRQAIARAAGELHKGVWAPLVKHLAGAKAVVVAPDGALCQFPLAALPGGKAGGYLLEEVALAQLASARQLLDLLRPAGKVARRGRGLLALGGVDYGKGATYPALPGAAVEAERCRRLFRNAFPAEPAVTLSGAGATVQVVRQALAGKKPRFLHLATHGFFEPPDRVERLLKGLWVRPDALELRQEQTTTLAGLPLLRCGLALAGANRPPPADDRAALPGILTGQDLEDMDLRGCELAVLSACQTALGDVKRSQGVLGLQRSFHAAGVKAMVTSLWSVHDAATLELMDEFYSRLWGRPKVSRLEALRQAQLAILRDPQRVRRRTAQLLADARKRGVPEAALRGISRLALDLPEGGKVGEAPKRSPEAWWAAFVLSGDWR